MQRIDDDTFIDDTLVACAEYQLFVDEMRDQGRNFQPDHWTSHHFPQGQASAPILGIRPSDAWAFCEWLARRQDDEWRYRLPTRYEATLFPMKIYAEAVPLGYWIFGPDPASTFSWIGPDPTNPRGPSGEAALQGAIFHELRRGVRGDRALALARTLARNLKHNLDGPLNLDRTLGLARDLDIDRNLDVDVKSALQGPIHASELTRTLDRALDRALAVTRNQDLALDLAPQLALDLARERARDFGPASAIFIDLITLLERIAGRSPAFEGIRLVKQRGT
jgi:hypothetical protein